eukprot:sb/3477340/
MTSILTPACFNRFEPEQFQFSVGIGRKTLKSGCLSLLTIRSFGARDGLGLSVRVWLGFGLGGQRRVSEGAAPIPLHDYQPRSLSEGTHRWALKQAWSSQKSKRIRIVEG